MHVENVNVPCKKVTTEAGEWIIVRDKDGNFIKTAGPDTVTAMPATHTVEAVSQVQVESIQAAARERLRSLRLRRIRWLGSP